MIHRGLLPSLVGISHVAIQFPAYEKIKSYFAKRDNTTTSKLSPGKLVIASAVSKLVASVMTYPHEILPPEERNSVAKPESDGGGSRGVGQLKEEQGKG
ncbi:unnamed protein product [Camellia sinensis]